MYPIKFIEDLEQKARITDQILYSIPDWFGIEESIMEYVQGVKDKPFYAVYHGDEAIGFISIKLNNSFTADIYVIGIRGEYHRKGIGTQLLHTAEQMLRKENYRFLMVKTLAPSANYEPYDRTRAYYQSVGFYPVEEIVEIWGKENPCLIMIKNI